MTLSQQDLQSIGNLLDQKLEEKLESKLKEKLMPLRKDINSLKKGQRELLNELRLVTRVFDLDLSYQSRCIKDLYRKTGFPELPRTT